LVVLVKLISFVNYIRFFFQGFKDLKSCPRFIGGSKPGPDKINILLLIAVYIVDRDNKDAIIAVNGA
jgi:hypothetical protein